MKRVMACALVAGVMGLGLTQQAMASLPGHGAEGAEPAWMSQGGVESVLAALDAVPIPDGVASDEVWVSVDLGGQQLRVFRGDTVIKQIDHVAFGAGGHAPLRLQGSSVTPVGEFRVDRINRASRFRLFFGIDYPNQAVADDALKAGKISFSQYQYIIDYRARHGRAPHTTPLGGLIGLHGVGRGDPEVHRNWNWTEGCVAVENDEILALDAWVDIGTRVVIRA